MDSDIRIALQELVSQLQRKYPELTFEHHKKKLLQDIIKELSVAYPAYKKHFSPVLKNSFIKPDGGFLYATDKDRKRKLILIAEVKRQGTNDKRKEEGLGKQAKGNAIERLGKNLTGIRAILKHENILPFVCFGSGCDFQKGSSIVDRVVTMNDFFPLNRMFVAKKFPPFEPVSMFFHYDTWTVEQMTDIMLQISEKAIRHYFH